MDDKDITLYVLTGTLTVGSAGFGLEYNHLLTTPLKPGTLEACRFLSPDDYHSRDQNREPLRGPRIEVMTTASSTAQISTIAQGMQIGDSIFTWPQGNYTSS